MNAFFQAGLRASARFAENLLDGLFPSDAVDHARRQADLLAEAEAAEEVLEPAKCDCYKPNGFHLTSCPAHDYKACLVCSPLSSAPDSPPVVADSPSPSPRAEAFGEGHPSSVSAVSSSPDTRGPGAGSTDRPPSEVVIDLTKTVAALVDKSISATEWAARADYARDCLIPEGRDLAAQLADLEN